jgi:hypothetical protein
MSTPKPKAERAKPVTLSMTPEHQRRLKELGGSKFVQQAIDKAYDELPEFVKQRPMPELSAGTIIKFKRFMLKNAQPPQNPPPPATKATTKKASKK